MNEKELDRDTQIVKTLVDKLNDTFADYFFGENEKAFEGKEIGGLMSAGLFTFFIMGIQKMNLGVKQSFDAGDYLQFIKQKVIDKIDALIQEQKNG